MICIRCADEGEILLIRDREDDPPIGPLEEIAFVVIVKPFGHNMAAAHQPHPFGGVQPHGVVNDLAHPWAARVDQHFRADHFLRAVLAVLNRHGPDTTLARGREHFGLCQDAGTAQFCVAGVQHHKARVFNPAIGIFERFFEPILQRRTFGRAAQRQAAGGGQNFAPAEIVIEKQAQADQPRRTTAAHPRHEQPQHFGGRRIPLEPHVAVIGQHEAHRPRDMRHGFQQHFAFGQRVTHEANLEILKVAQTAVEQFGRGRRGRGGQIIHLGQGHAKTPPCGIARNTSPVNTTTDDEKIDRGRGHMALGLLVHDPALPKLRLSNSGAVLRNDSHFHKFYFRLCSFYQHSEHVKRKLLRDCLR